MRIALFSGNYNYVTDGANKALNRLVRFMESRGAEVRVFSPTTKTPAFEPAGTLIPVWSFPMIGRGEYKVGYPVVGKPRRILEAFKPNLIHCSSPDWLNNSAAKFGVRRGVPVVASYHTRFDIYFRYYGIGFVEKMVKQHMQRFYAMCQHVYAPSQSMADALAAEGMVRPEAIRIWSRGIELERFSPKRRDLDWRRSLGFGDDEVVISFVGRLVREKGFRRYAAVMEALWARGLPVQALIVGDGPERDPMAERLPRAVFTGHLAGDDLARAYASSDIYFNPSVTETFGNVTLEAMASGVATVAMQATGSSSIIEHDSTGLLLNMDEQDRWIDVFADLCSQPEFRRRLAQAGYQESQKYSWDRINQALLDQYCEIVAPERALAQHA